MKKFTLQSVFVFFVVCFCAGTVNAVPLAGLFDSGTYQFNDLLLSDWDLVNSSNINLDKLEVKTNVEKNRLEVWGKDYALKAGENRTKTISFDFYVTPTGNNLDKVWGFLGNRQVNGYSWNSPWIKGNFNIGTTKGSNDLGSSSGIFSLNQDSNSDWSDLADGIDSFWMRSTLTIAGKSGYAFAGYAEGYGPYGPALGYSFEEKEVAPIPEPATILLFTTGLAGLAGIKRKKFKV